MSGNVRQAKGSALNVKQELFVKYYLTSFDAKFAAIKSGYSEKTAASQGARLLNNAKVEKMIHAEMARLRERMADDANKIYAGLWSEVNEITDKINEHYQAQKVIKKLVREKNAIFLSHMVDDENMLRDPNALQEVRGINFNLQEASMDIMSGKDFLRAQELRAKLLHDLFDRAGYKPTDKIDLQQNISGGLDLSYMTDEELEKEAAKL